CLPRVTKAARSHPRNAVATRQAILEAAKRRFSSQPYEQVGVREVAADAGVDASLVNRYFGSKEKLFAEVIAAVFDAARLRDIPRSELAASLARYVAVEAPRRPSTGNDPLLLMMLSAPSPAAKGLLRA